MVFTENIDICMHTTCTFALTYTHTEHCFGARDSCNRWHMPAIKPFPCKELYRRHNNGIRNSIRTTIIAEVQLA